MRWRKLGLSQKAKEEERRASEALIYFSNHVFVSILKSYFSERQF